jgi:rubrerythrin
MGIEFNAAEIFALAEQIERNGAAFYRTAAAKYPPARELLLTLAQQEDGHLATFTAMRRQLGERETEAVIYDPDNEAAIYLKTLADHRVFNVDQDPKAVLGENVSLARVLAVATGMEKESIAFYAGMKPLVPPALGQDRLDAIIREEWKHIAFLLKLSDELRASPA